MRKRNDEFMYRSVRRIDEFLVDNDVLEPIELRFVLQVSALDDVLISKEEWGGGGDLCFGDGGQMETARVRNTMPHSRHMYPNPQERKKSNRSGRPSARPRDSGILLNEP